MVAARRLSAPVSHAPEATSSGFHDSGLIHAAYNKRQRTTPAKDENKVLKTITQAKELGKTLTCSICRRSDESVMFRRDPYPADAKEQGVAVAICRKCFYSAPSPKLIRF